ncbi:MAG: xanthine dehydrogenase family protein subunit M [Aurantimonas endophytica]|uniref:Xanthine dehydrogenase YagS FAD-binding subunit n=1 Tax=Aurantimonas endophytica TaxID=1522175 RepID=A0A7W6HEC6_9HYPH|nr:xanthine dehydrogenase family protein subunit M [Aurantimonas endophytica]MBB4003659.1 xanthine dehydrogenase YagS FAD-binding subunit [Aurantimonas endophytica]MCO6404516.1 xanthine dehydrogenase family protein subunit M [Aurantimonas endophytica]
MRPFHYMRPASAEEAVSAFMNSGEGARYIAGGTSMYDLMKLNIERPSHLIDIASIDGLDRIETDGEELRFGALALMSAVAGDPVVAREYPILAESLTKAASQQLRNMATVGGNLLQRTRCLYFRNGSGGTSNVGVYPCNKREAGSGCAAIGGLDRGQAVLGTSEACTAVSPGDWPVALLAMDASLEVLGPSGSRSLPVDDLYRLPGDTPDLEFTLAPGEIITAIIVPKNAAGVRSTYHKIRDRESYAFALTSAAVALEMNGERVGRAHIALGGVATRPWRASAAEKQLTGQTLTAETALAAGRAAFSNATAGRHNSFKTELGARTVADAITIAAERS